jgi:ribosomal protein S6--L-glutamate ligase
MALLSADKAVRLTLRRWLRAANGPFYLQRFIPNAERDMGVAILDGKIIGAYYRVARAGNWMTTTAAGGHYEPAEVPEVAAEMALKAVSVFGLDFSSVDLVQTDAGWLAYEVSAFGGFSGLRKTSEVDAPALYARYVIEKTYG